MSDPVNPTADDTDTAAAGPPEAGNVTFPAENVAPDVEVSEVRADDATAAAGNDPAGAGGHSLTDDVNPDAGAPEPTD